MPFDSFNGGIGTEVLYPHDIMNSQFSEPEWTSSNPVLLGPDDYETSYPAPRIPPPIEVSPLPGHVVSVPRPKSSPSTFGPNVEDLLFPENPFRLKSDEYMPPMYSMAPLQTSKAPPNSLYGADYGLSTTTMSPTQSGPIPIAPDPIGLRQMNALKRMREEEDYSDFNQKRRKRAPSQTGPVELNDEEQLLLKLKEEENLPWKDIAVRFQTDLGKSYQVPALQMRFKRLRERMRTWTETDHWNKPTITGRNSSSTSSPQRCWTSAHPNDGLPNTAHASGTKYIPGDYHSTRNPTSSKTRGTPNIAARWSQ